jgi:cytochrome c5
VGIVLGRVKVSEHRSTEFGTSVVALIAIGLLVALVYVLTAGRFVAPAVGAGTPEEIAARLAPVGSVKVASATPTQPAAAAKPAPTPGEQASTGGGDDAGKALFDKTCSACHATGVAGAPKLGDKAAWEPRIAQGMDALLHSAINGKNAMPPRGTCANCSDAELKAAIEYMVSKVQ